MKKAIYMVLALALALNTAHATTTATTEKSAIANFAGDDKNKVEAQLRLARHLIEVNRNYERAKNEINKALNIDPDNAEANELLELCNQLIAEEKAAKARAELEAYNAACTAGTVEALQAFIANNKDSKYAKNAQERIDDYKLCATASAAGTKEAYNQYLAQSKTKAYKQDAEQRIREIEMEEAWEKCAAAPSIEGLSSYLAAYPGSAHDTEAKYQLNILKGEESYARDDYATAYDYFSAADAARTLTGTAREHYENVLEWRKFNEVMASSDIYTVKSYLGSLSYSNPYRNKVSNHCALLLAKELDMHSTDETCDNALSYAKDEQTRTTVQRYIRSANNARAQYRRQQRKYARKRWWKENFKWGIEGDFETNLNGEYAGTGMMYSAGLVFRFGGYQHVFNMTLGVKYRWITAEAKDSEDDLYYGDESSWSASAGAIGIPLNLRFNVAEVSKRSRFFIGAGMEYGAAVFEDKVLEGGYESSYFALMPQIGITSPNFDISLYWKTYLKSPYTDDVTDYLKECKTDNMIGIQMAIMF